MAMRFGTEGGDTLYGTADADWIKGFGGDDMLKGGGGADRLDGGAGIDMAFYSDSAVGVNVNLTLGRGLFGTAEGDTLTNIENIFGSAHDDILVGNDVANTLIGSSGHDQLFGRGGADRLDGEFGSDLLNGGGGADILNGGEGRDTADWSGSPVGVFASLISNFVSGGDADGDTLVSIESLQGSQLDDHLWGDDGVNALAGLRGNDTLKGYGGGDFLMGGLGHDTLHGMTGDDSLSGEEGNDRLIGGRGADRMSGGSETDIFVWSSIDDTGTTMATADLIVDFRIIDGDRLDLGDVDADVYATGNQTFTFIGAAAFSGTPGEINYVHVDGETIIQMQTGTSADVEGVIRIDGIVTPQANWFNL